MPNHAARVEAARQCWNAGDLPGYLSLYDEHIRLHGYAPEAMNKTAVKAFYEQVYAALGEEHQPNPVLTFHEVLVDGDLYCCRFTMAGVHRGSFLGIPATGRRYVLPGITVMRFAGANVVERWSSADMLGLLVQLGAVSPPAG